MRIEKTEVGAYQANCYAVIDEATGRALIIDPGDEADRLEAWVRQMHITPEAIFLTHGHFDHIGAAAQLAQKWQTDILLHPDEVAYMNDRSHPMMAMTSGILDELLAALPQKGRYIVDQEKVAAAGCSFRALEVPGHSDHSLCLYAEKEGVLFSGDALFAGSVGRTDLYHGGPSDLVAAVEEKLMALPDSTKVFPGHGPSTTIGQERRSNPFLRR